MSPEPGISVVIPTCDRPDDLRRAVASVLAQDWTDLEVVVSIEAGDVQSEAVLAAIREAAGDPRLRWVHNAVRNGPGPNRDNGVRAARGPWLAFLDDDDVWLPGRLSQQMAIAGPDTIVTCLTRIETDEGVFIRPGCPYDGSRPVDAWMFDRQTWLRGGDAMLQTSSLLVPRSAYDAVGGFGTSRHEDWELVIRATQQHGYRLVTAPAVLVVHHWAMRHSWEASLPWVETMRDVMSPRAVAGFCLNSATQAIVGPGRNRGFVRYLRAAFRLGHPTARQLFAFVLIWALPRELRARLRAVLQRRK